MLLQWENRLNPSGKEVHVCDVKFITVILIFMQVHGAMGCFCHEYMTENWQKLTVSWRFNQVSLPNDCQVISLDKVVVMVKTCF